MRSTTKERLYFGTFTNRVQCYNVSSGAQKEEDIKQRVRFIFRSQNLQIKGYDYSTRYDQSASAGKARVLGYVAQSYPTPAQMRLTTPFGWRVFRIATSSQTGSFFGDFRFFKTWEVAFGKNYFLDRDPRPRPSLAPPKKLPLFGGGAPITLGASGDRWITPSVSLVRVG